MRRLRTHGVKGRVAAPHQTTVTPEPQTVYIPNLQEPLRGLLGSLLRRFLKNAPEMKHDRSPRPELSLQGTGCFSFSGRGSKSA